MGLSHAEAKKLVDGLPGVNAVESLFLRAVSWHETNYGAGWGSDLEKGGGSWNMGAITTSRPNELSFKHVDSRFDPKVGKVVQYTTWFSGHKTATDGFAQLRDVVLKANVRSSLANRDILDAVSGMYDNHYFLGLKTHENDEGNKLNIEAYYSAVAKAIETIGRATGEVHPFVLPPEAAR